MTRRGIGGLVVYSGDLVVRDEDGYLFYKGRRDGLIKISGNRISYAEVEAAAIAFPGTPAAAAGALPASEPGGDPRLVLFIEGTGDPAHREALDAHLRRTLPGYAVPSRLVFLPVLPLNQNGKYDVKRLVADLETGDA
jgi:acyl-coenzyme A synthetase/AMP-(fatty) acid ligase